MRQAHVLEDQDARAASGHAIILLEADRLPPVAGAALQPGAGGGLPTRRRISGAQFG
jgi:hypothetical protein